MSIFIVKIEPDGEVIRCEGTDFLAVAERGCSTLPGYSGPTGWGGIVENARGIDVCSVPPHTYAPLPSTTAPTVFALHEWGRLLRLPVNRKAWALYGRSPLVGPVWVATDDRAPLSDRWIEIISRPIEQWVPADVLQAMTRVLRIEGMAT